MKKSIFIFILLLLISVGSIIAVHAVIYPEKDNISLKETVLYGDKSAANELHVKTNLGSDNHLFWTTECNIGEKNEVLTDFTFSHKAQQHFYEGESSAISLYTSDNFGLQGGVDTDIIKNEAIKAAIENSAPGETHTEKIRLKDYYDFFPLNININFELKNSGSGISYSYMRDDLDFWGDEYNDDLNKNLYEDFVNFFRFAVPDNYMQKITVGKDDKGNVIDLSLESYLSSDDPDTADSALTPDVSPTFYLDTISALTDDACYFTFLLNDSAVDTSFISGGYGIYCLPFEVLEDDSDSVFNQVKLHSEQLKMVYGISENAEIKELELSPDGTKLLLVTEENGSFFLTVLDAKNVKELQKIEIMQKGSDVNSAFDRTFLYDGFMVVANVDGRLTLLSEDSSGLYNNIFTTAPVLGEYEYLLWDYNSGFAWDGEKLAMATYAYQKYDYDDGSYGLAQKCSFIVTVFGSDSKMLYQGYYASSLDTSGDDAVLFQGRKFNYSLNDSKCLPLEDTVIDVDWD